MRTASLLVLLSLVKVFIFNSALAQKEVARVSISDFGAQGNGLFLNTDAFRKAISEVEKAGGGIVFVPNGVFRTGTIELKSNVYLELSAGARILGSEDLKDYKQFPGHNYDKYRYSLITASDVENTGIIGFGVIDGQGDKFWEQTNEEMPYWIKAKEPRVSRFIEFERCKNVNLRDFTIYNSPEWSLHIFSCDQVNIDNIKIDNHLFGPNNDGIDITGSIHVTVSNCKIKTCDDGICLKTMPETGSCENITVTNCVIETSCVALKIGNESVKDFRNISISNCVVIKSSRAIGIYAEEGGTVENVTLNNISLETNAPLVLNRAIHISLGKSKRAKGDSKIRNVSISNIVGSTQGRILITAAPNFKIENLMLNNIALLYPYIEDPFETSDEASSAQYSPWNKEARRQRAAMILENVDGLRIENFNIKWPADSIPSAWKHKKRIENGPQPRVFWPKYERPKEVEFIGIWLKGVANYSLSNPLLQASSKRQVPVKIVK